MGLERIFLFGEGKAGRKTEFSRKPQEVVRQGSQRGEKAIKSVEDKLCQV